MTGADWIGVYGAALATVLALREYCLSRPKLRVRAYVAQLSLTIVVPGRTTRFDYEALPTGDGPFLAFRVTNCRQVPVTVGRVGGVQDGNRFSVDYPPVPLPRVLASGEGFDFAADPKVIRKGLSRLAVWDQTGRAWKVPWWNLIALKVQAGAVRVPWSWLDRQLAALAKRQAEK